MQQKLEDYPVMVNQLEEGGFNSDQSSTLVGFFATQERRLGDAIKQWREEMYADSRRRQKEERAERERIRHEERVEYDRIRAQEREEYERVRKQEREEYERVRKQEFAEFERSRKREFAEYEQSRERERAEIDRRRKEDLDRIVSRLEAINLETRRWVVTTLTTLVVAFVASAIAVGYQLLVE